MSDQQSSMWTPALILEAGMQPFIAPHEDSDEGVAEAVAVGLDMLCDEVTSRGSLVDRERGIAVIRLDPTVARRAEHLAETSASVCPRRHYGGCKRQIIQTVCYHCEIAELLRLFARIIGGESE